MFPDIVYIYGEGYSKWRGREFRYSLRSLEKYGKNYGKVFVIGDKPPYLNDKIIHIPATEAPHHLKERRILEKLLVACETQEISNPFIFFNDDFFLLKEIDFSIIDYYHSEEDLIEKHKKRQVKDYYAKALYNTIEVLKSRNLPIKHFDIHYPMKYEKDKFIEIMNEYNWDQYPVGFVIKSLYANTLKIEGKIRSDKKIKLIHNKKAIIEQISDTDLFSTDEISRAMAELFDKLYSKPSIFENQENL